MKFSEINNLPVKFKMIIGGVAILSVIIYSLFLIYNTEYNKRQFYKNGFSAIVLSSKDYQLKGIEFNLSNDLKIIFPYYKSYKMEIGDSVKKVPNTFVYDVYRKDSLLEYKLFATYYFGD